MPPLVDQERIFVGAMLGAAVFHDAHAAGGNLVLDAMVEQNHAVGDIFFEAVARERAFAPFRGDDGGETRGP